MENGETFIFAYGLIKISLRCHFNVSSKIRVQYESGIANLWDVIILVGFFLKRSVWWHIIAENTFWIVKSCNKLDYILFAAKSFFLYTDNNNFDVSYDPATSNPKFSRHGSNRIKNWTFSVASFPKDTVYIGWGDNVWADLCSRGDGSSDSCLGYPYTSFLMLASPAPIR